MISGFAVSPFIVIAATLVLSAFFVTLAEAAWDKFQAGRKKPPTPKWEVRFFDPDGIQTRTDTLPAKSVARMIDYLNRGFFD